MTDIRNGNISVLKVGEIFNTSIAYEFGIYRRIWNAPRLTVGFPQVMFLGAGQEFNYFAIERLGTSLLDMMNTNGPFSLKTVLLVGIQMLHRLEHIHNTGILHLDIKPGNLMSGGTKLTKGVLHLIDFGLSRIFLDEKGEQKGPLQRVPGTTRFASSSLHRGEGGSPRDDIESLLYTLVFLYRGTLPWTRSCQGSDYYYSTLKRNSQREYCEGLPMFHEYADYMYNLGFRDKPDYEMLRFLLRNAFSEAGFRYDGATDWVELGNTVEIERVGMEEILGKQADYGHLYSKM